jgi:hypothetical protein
MPEVLYFLKNQSNGNRGLLALILMSSVLLGVMLFRFNQRDMTPKTSKSTAEMITSFPSPKLEMTPPKSTVNKLPFDRLKINAIENQKQGSVRTDEAIPAQELVFTDAKSWQGFWAKNNITEFPIIDFNTTSVAAVFLGARGDGYDVRIKEITYDPQRNVITIYVVELLPSPEQILLGVVTYPADVVSFSSKEAEVEFIREQKVGR